MPYRHPGSAHECNLAGLCLWPARDTIEHATGCPSLFLQGCGGNINPASGIGQDSTGNEDTVRLGRMLGGEVLKVWSGLRSHRKRALPTYIPSVSPYWLYEYESIPIGDEGVLQASEMEMTLPLTPFAPIEEMRRERDDWAFKLRDVIARNGRESERNVAERFAYWSNLRLATAEKHPDPLPLTFPLQVIQIGEITIAAIPFETMNETGFAIQRLASDRNVFVLGYSNGIVTYLPTPTVSREGGMEARIGYKNYLVPSEIPGDWEPQINEAVICLIRPPDPTRHQGAGLQ